MRPRRLPALAAAAVLLPAAGCVRLQWHVQHREEPLPAVALAALRPGHDDLAGCLRTFGAPHFVWEYDGDGCALAWYHVDVHGFGLNVSYSVIREASASFSLDLDSTDVPGVVLWFGPDLVLAKWQQGRLRELTRGLRTRPAAPAGDAPDGGRDG